jgi:hypothetical protein
VPDQVRGSCLRPGDLGADPSAAPSADQHLGAHQPLDRAAGHRDGFAVELSPDLAGTVDAVVLRVNPHDLCRRGRPRHWCAAEASSPAARRGSSHLIAAADLVTVRAPAGDPMENLNLAGVEQISHPHWICLFPRALARASSHPSAGSSSFATSDAGAIRQPQPRLVRARRHRWLPRARPVASGDDGALVV